MAHPLRLPLVAWIVATPLAVVASDAPLTFERDVRPILKANCFHCHGEEEHKAAGLDLRLVKLIAAGGDSGSALTPADPDASLLWDMLASDEMPKGPKKLSSAQKEIVRKWIEQGATTARPELADPAEARFTPEELAHWSFQPVVKPQVPAVDGHSGIDPIDAFLLARIHERGISGFSAPADKRTLVRRATFDLTGLPPTPEEVDQFLRDESPTAYEALVDRLLASHHYGERWGRHWLDVAGYSESDGNPNMERPRPNAWHYRDYVVASFNADKPYDRFVQEQLAGDELATQPHDLRDPRTVELLTATGFLRMSPDFTDTSENISDRNQAVADVLRVTTSSLLGMTVACAQCHDHRYDPISHEDYHRLRAIFDPAMNLHAWKNPSAREVDVTTAEMKQAAEAIEAQVQAQLAEINQRRRQRAQEIHDAEVAKVPEADRAQVVAAISAAEAARTPEHRALLERYPAVKTVDFIAGFLVEYDNPAFQKFSQEDAAANKLRETKPPVDLRMVVAESADSLPETKLFFRGDPAQPRQTIFPGEPRVVAQHRDTPEIPLKNPALATSGRRLAWARRLTDGTHPLVSRAIVNRIWKLHFSRGLVDTPGDLGLNGDRPSHPELLDWLASQFVEEGWSIKRLHRRILLTAAYRQQAARTPELDRVDPDNRLLARRSVRRLEAEEIRDALLAVSGTLNASPYGTSVPVTLDIDGIAVIGKRTLNSSGKPEGPLEQVAAEQARRRSVYLANHRAMPMTMLDAFDLPVMSPNCDSRRCSTVPTQSLIFMNDKSLIAHAGDLADRLLREAPTGETRVFRVYALLYAAEPTAEETAACLDFHAQQADRFRTTGDAAWKESLAKTPEDAERRALASLCQVLFSANRFIYVD